MENNIKNFPIQPKSGLLDYSFSKNMSKNEEITKCELCFQFKNSLEIRDHIYMEHFRQQIDEEIEICCPLTLDPESPVSCPIKDCDFKSPFYR